MDGVGGDRRGGGDEGQHSVHKDAAQGVAQAADAGGHSFAQDRGGLLPGEVFETEAEEDVLFAEVGEKDCQRDIVADAGGDAHFQRISVEKQHCRQVHHDIRDGKKDRAYDREVPVVVEGHEAVEDSHQVHCRQAKGDSDQIVSGQREKVRGVP